jgi:hypothetical protein
MSAMNHVVLGIRRRACCILDSGMVAVKILPDNEFYNSFVTEGSWFLLSDSR